MILEGVHIRRTQENATHKMYPEESSRSGHSFHADSNYAIESQTACPEQPSSSRKRPAPHARGAHRPRAVLTATQAMQIYLYRPGACEPLPDAVLRGDSRMVGVRFGVSPKTVRDIWARRSWAEETRPLGAPGERPSPPPQRRPRPPTPREAARAGGVGVERPLPSAGAVTLLRDAAGPPQVPAGRGRGRVRGRGRGGGKGVGCWERREEKGSEGGKKLSHGEAECGEWREAG